jgi:hypothetical protein
LRRDAAADCIKYGKGIIKVWPGQGCVEWTIVWCGDVFTHKREEAARHVRTKYQIAFIDREVAKQMWPANKVEIGEAKAPSAKLLLESGAEDDDDLIVIYEAWRLPSGKTKKGEPIGGRHVVCIDTCTLEDDDWPHDFFPFVELVAPGDNETNQGIGYPERMAGGQAEQNAMAELTSDVVRLMTPKYCLENGSQYTPDTATNTVAEFWAFTGTMPQILSAEGNILAISKPLQSSARVCMRSRDLRAVRRGAAPDNPDSGKAKLVHRDIEAERHAELAKRRGDDRGPLQAAHLVADAGGGCEARRRMRASRCSRRSSTTTSGSPTIRITCASIRCRPCPTRRRASSPSSTRC